MVVVNFSSVASLVQLPSEGIILMKFSRVKYNETVHAANKITECTENVY